jgi:hypothetical protein
LSELPSSTKIISHELVIFESSTETASAKIKILSASLNAGDTTDISTELLS